MQPTYPAPAAGFALEAVTADKAPDNLLLPVSISITVHLCLLLGLPRLIPNAELIEVSVPYTTSMQISFSPRPAAVEPRSTSTEQQLPPPTSEPPDLIDAPQTPSPPSPTPPLSQPDMQSAPPLEAPKLPVPTLLDVRDLLRTHASQTENARRYHPALCDERQQRSKLIDCTEENTGNEELFAAAAQNPAVEFVTHLNTPASQPDREFSVDRTDSNTRTRATLENMNGNLGANALIRSVINHP